jgi:hypothetical protein
VGFPLLAVSCKANTDGLHFAPLRSRQITATVSITVYGRSNWLNLEHNKKPTQKMIYLATYNRQSEIQHLRSKSKSLLFIDAAEKLALEKVITLVKKLTEGDFEESSVEIIGEKAWDAAKIKHPRIKFHKLD